jgi:hypothetical protein
MAYEVGQTLTVAHDIPDSPFFAGETVEVLAVDDDGTPVVGILGTPDTPVGKAVRIHEDIEDHFE